MKTIVFYSTLASLLIATLAGLAIVTAVWPTTTIGPAPSRRLVLPAPVVPAS